MTVESRLDVETQHPKWQGIAKLDLTTADALEKEALIKGAIEALAAKAREAGIGEWPADGYWTTTIVKPDLVAAKAIRIHVDQQPFTTWDKLFAQLVWPASE